MQFNPAAGKVHTVVPPGHSCCRIAPWLSVFTGRTLRACSAECSRGTGCTRQSTAQLSHHTRSVSGTSIDNSKHEAEPGTKGLHNGLLSRCANTQHHPSCSLQKEPSTLHTRPKRKRLHYSHLAGSACRMFSAQSRVRYFNIMHPMSHSPCFPAEMAHRNLQADARIP